MSVGGLPAWPDPGVPGFSFLALVLHLAASCKVQWVGGTARGVAKHGLSDPGGTRKIGKGSACCSQLGWGGGLAFWQDCLG